MALVPETTDICSLTVLEAGRPKSRRYGQLWFPVRVFFLAHVAFSRCKAVIGLVTLLIRALIP